MEKLKTKNAKRKTLDRKKQRKRRKKVLKKKGFTLIELVMVIVILGILAAVAIPRFFDLATEARESAEAGVVGGVRGGIATFYADALSQGGDPDTSWPAELDDPLVATAGSTCGSAIPFFHYVLAQGGITDVNWSKGAGVNDYIGPAGGIYEYDPLTGEFTTP